MKFDSFDVVMCLYAGILLALMLIPHIIFQPRYESGFRRALQEQERRIDTSILNTLLDIDKDMVERVKNVEQRVSELESR